MGALSLPSPALVSLLSCPGARFCSLTPSAPTPPQKMLARRGVSLALRVAGRRTMCAPALTSESLASTIADCQARMDSKFVAPYTEEKLAADLEAGTVDSTALKEMVGFNDKLMKVRRPPVANLFRGRLP